MKRHTLAHVKEGASAYHLNNQGFFIDDYNHQKTFSNFFPGISGLWGIPMWVFYVNRGQCISSFGIESKDKAILEFQPANKAYQMTSLHGFRTFIKIKNGKKIYFWEPFQNQSGFSPYRSNHKMKITSHDLTIEDINHSLGLKVEVNYFSLPEESFPALVRRVKVSNISKQKYGIEVVDGLPLIMPYGMNDWTAKHMSRTVEAFSRVELVESNTPFYHLKVEVSDTPKIKHIKEGYFYLSFNPDLSKPKCHDVIVHKTCVFGNSSDLRIPENFYGQEKFRVPKRQQVENSTPSALSFFSTNLSAKGSFQMASVVGYAPDKKELKRIVPLVMAKGFIEKKSLKNKALIEDIKNYSWTKSASQEFDMYCQQTFLDNIMRGGLPVTFKTPKGKFVLNVYSRKHGDLERDYNYFVLAPTPFSQGNGNYRDVNQNRRNDVWFNPDVKENHIRDFLNLIQADGYNPLVVKGLSFIVDDHKQIDRLIKKYCFKNDADLRQKLEEGFQPGELLAIIYKKKIRLRVTQKKFLEQVMAVSGKQMMAEHGEGFWTDHWTYNLDLIESFFAIYPERLKELLMEKGSFDFYLNSYYVLPRSKRYTQTPNGIRQYHSVFNASKVIRAGQKDHKLRCRNGKGEVYKTSMVTKMLCLIANKAATLDPSGIGIEMEADKPNWYDALNGLPGLIGSSLSETIELKRYAVFLMTALQDIGCGDEYMISVYEELADFIRELSDVLENEKDSLPYWQRANDIKEHYRSRTRLGIAGEQQKLSIKEVLGFLDLVIKRTDVAITRVQNNQGLLSTYFYHEVVDFDCVDRDQNAEGPRYVYPKRFKLHRLPLFLEGFVHALRVEADQSKAKKIFRSLKKSDLYDKKLNMYKVNADLSKETEEIGRSFIFPAGWLENGSVWLHMEYKYLLELLRCGLNKEYCDTLKAVLVPFLKPEEYGRSIIENSSFIVSSVHPDESLHGQGFVARLSGSTAEFINMWLWMSIGRNPFRWDAQNGLSLVFEPILPSWLFTLKESILESRSKRKKGGSLPKNTYAFNFLGTILTVYHNPKRKDTFRGCYIEEIHLTYPRKSHPIIIKNDKITAPYVQDVRDRKISRIDVFFK